jgi:hypothetical protein
VNSSLSRGYIFCPPPPHAWLPLPHNGRLTKWGGGDMLIMPRLSSSLWVRDQRFQLCLQHDERPPSFLLVDWKSHMARSSMTSFYMAAQIRVKNSYHEIYLSDFFPLWISSYSDSEQKCIFLSSFYIIVCSAPAITSYTVQFTPLHPPPAIPLSAPRHMI